MPSPIHFFSPRSYWDTFTTRQRRHRFVKGFYPFILGHSRRIFLLRRGRFLRFFRTLSFFYFLSIPTTRELRRTTWVSSVNSLQSHLLMLSALRFSQLVVTPRFYGLSRWLPGLFSNNQKVFAHYLSVQSERRLSLVPFTAPSALLPRISLRAVPFFFFDRPSFVFAFLESKIRREFSSTHLPLLSFQPVSFLIPHPLLPPSTFQFPQAFSNSAFFRFQLFCFFYLARLSEVHRAYFFLSALNGAIGRWWPGSLAHVTRRATAVMGVTQRIRAPVLAKSTNFFGQKHVLKLFCLRPIYSTARFLKRLHFLRRFSARRYPSRCFNFMMYGGFVAWRNVLTSSTPSARKRDYFYRKKLSVVFRSPLLLWRLNVATNRFFFLSSRLSSVRRYARHPYHRGYLRLRLLHFLFFPSNYLFRDFSTLRHFLTWYRTNFFFSLRFRLFSTAPISRCRRSRHGFFLSVQRQREPLLPLLISLSGKIGRECLVSFLSRRLWRTAVVRNYGSLWRTALPSFLFGFMLQLFQFSLTFRVRSRLLFFAYYRRSFRPRLRFVSLFSRLAVVRYRFQNFSSTSSVSNFISVPAFYPHRSPRFFKQFRCRIKFRGNYVTTRFFEVFRQFFFSGTNRYRRIFPGLCFVSRFFSAPRRLHYTNFFLSAYRRFRRTATVLVYRAQKPAITAVPGTGVRVAATPASLRPTNFSVTARMMSRLFTRRFWVDEGRYFRYSRTLQAMRFVKDRFFVFSALRRSRPFYASAHLGTVFLRGRRFRLRNLAPFYYCGFFFPPFLARWLRFLYLDFLRTRRVVDLYRFRRAYLLERKKRFFFCRSRFSLRLFFLFKLLNRFSASTVIRHVDVTQISDYARHIGNRFLAFRVYTLFVKRIWYRRFRYRRAFSRARVNRFLFFFRASGFSLGRFGNFHLPHKRRRMLHCSALRLRRSVFFRRLWPCVLGAYTSTPYWSRPFSVNLRFFRFFRFRKNPFRHHHDRSSTRHFQRHRRKKPVKRFRWSPRRWWRHAFSGQRVVGRKPFRKIIELRSQRHHFRCNFFSQLLARIFCNFRSDQLVVAVQSRRVISRGPTARFSRYWFNHRQFYVSADPTKRKLFHRVSCRPTSSKLFSRRCTDYLFRRHRSFRIRRVTLYRLSRRWIGPRYMKKKKGRKRRRRKMMYLPSFVPRRFFGFRRRRWSFTERAVFSYCFVRMRFFLRQYSYFSHKLRRRCFLHLVSKKQKRRLRGSQSRWRMR